MKTDTFSRHLFFTAILLFFAINLVAQPKREFRAAWFTSAWRNDWPSVTGTTQAVLNTQKSELVSLFESLKTNNMNVVCFQVRNFTDAVYPSAHAPWTHQIAGSRGVQPYGNFDFLKFAIEEAHSRGMELHAWLNPFRLANRSLTNTGLTESDIINYGTDNAFLNPADPDVKTHLNNVINELITNYDIDGIVFDDYFYKSVPTNAPDAKEATFYNSSGYTNLANWRRDQVNQVIKNVRTAIDSSTKPWIRWGLGPFGLWSTSAHNVCQEGGSGCENVTAATYINRTEYATGSAANGNWTTVGNTIPGQDAYNVLYCDAMTWMKRGYIDYISPQLYWRIDGPQDYKALCTYWEEWATHFNRHFYVSQSVSYGDDYTLGSTTVHDRTIPEIRNQVAYNRTNSNIRGSIFFNTKPLIDNGFLADLKTNFYTKKALAPEITFRTSGNRNGTITNFARSGQTLTWNYNGTNWNTISGTVTKPVRFTVYACDASGDIISAMSDPQNLLGITYTTSLTLPSGYDTGDTKQYAVCVYDRVGKEYTTNAEYRNIPTEGDPLGTESCAAFSANTASSFNTTALWTRRNGDANVSSWLAAGSGNLRNIAVLDNTLFAVNYAEQKLHFINTSNGLLRKTININNLGSTYYLFCLKITSAGEFLVGNSVENNNTLKIFSLDTISGNCTELGSYNFGVRTDGFDVYGTLKDGFILTAGNASRKVLRIPLRGGQLISAEAKVWTRSETDGASVTWVSIQDENTFYLCPGVNLPHYKYVINNSASTLTAQAINWDVPPSLTPTNGAGGGCCTKIKFRTFYMSPYGKKGEVRVYDTYGTNPVHKGSTPEIGTSSSPSQITICAQEIGEKAYIYVLSPFNGIAKYELSMAAPAATLSVTNITSTSATLSGALNNGYPLSCIREEGFEITPCGGGRNVGQPIADVIGTNFTATAYDLDYDTRYAVRARARRYPSNATDVAYGGWVYFRTLGPTIITQEATNIMDVTATINGISVLKAGFTPTKCGFRYRVKNAASWTEVLENSGAVVRASNGTGISANLSGLVAKTTYEYQAFVKLPQGEYFGEVKEFTTVRPQFVIREGEQKAVPTFSAADPGDITIYKGGQASNNSTITAHGKFHFKQAFERNLYYPIVFPFDVTSVTYGDNKPLTPTYSNKSGKFLLKKFIDNQPEMPFRNRWELIAQPAGSVLIPKNTPFILEITQAALHKRELTFHSSEGEHTIDVTIPSDRGTSEDYQYFGNHTLKNQTIGHAWVLYSIYDQVMFANQGSTEIPAFECYVQVQPELMSMAMKRSPYIGFVERATDQTTDLEITKANNGSLTVWSDPSNIYITSAIDQRVTIFGTNGQRIATQNLTKNETVQLALPPAVYLVTTSNGEKPIKVVK